VNPTEPGAIGEAEAQRQATVTPWLWGGIGVLVIAAFVAWLVFWPAMKHPHEPPAAAPAINPIKQHS
jgi:hypothetical protein